MIHAHGDEGARAAVEAGAKSIEHGTFLSLQTLKLMKERDAYLVPTLITLFDLVEPGGDYDGAVVNMRGRYMIPKTEKVIKQAMDLGIKIATGADNNYTNESTSRVSMEVEHFRRLGMDAWQALATTTINAAELLGLSEITGQIATGYDADLIVLPDNPIIEAKALQDVVLVMSNGKIAVNRLPFGLD
jgi:imidazolonepropionase-like amidohydrolase